MITITEKAQEKIKEMQKDIGEETFLRFRVKSECCNELNYALSLTIHKTEHDLIIEFNDFIVLIHPSDVPLLKNTEIDYKDDGVDNGFIINNPNPLVSL
jgi:iron-sulfur cluster assembly accessory protein